MKSQTRRYTYEKKKDYSFHPLMCYYSLCGNFIRDINNETMRHYKKGWPFLYNIQHLFFMFMITDPCIIEYNIRNKVG